MFWSPLLCICVQTEFTAQISKGVKTNEFQKQLEKFNLLLWNLIKNRHCRHNRFGP